MVKYQGRLTIFLGLSLALLPMTASHGRPIADSSAGTKVLPPESKPNTEKTLVKIQGGTIVGNMLFHSFKEFSVPEKQTVRFTPKIPRDIHTIFSRVTGKKISHLRGKLQTKGQANLVFLNPNGIVFHKNFNLGIQGSFLVTTAESLIFEDGGRFSSKLAQSSPLLKLSVPNGLQFSTRPGGIQVFNSNDTGKFRNGLKINKFQDIALMGGDITVQASNILAQGGDIWLGSMEDSGIIQWNSGENWNFSPQNIQKGGKVNITDTSRIFSSFIQPKGGVNGTISLFGDQISIENSSLNAENRGKGPGGDIILKAAQTIDLKASDPFSRQSSPTLTTQPRAKGSGGSIFLSAQNINIISESLKGELRRIVSDSARSRADINARLLGQPGNIQLNADQRISLAGGSVVSAVSSALESNNQSGDIEIRAKNLDIFGGSQIRTSTESLQSGGRLTVEVDEMILLSGVLDFINNQGQRVFRPSALVTDSNRNNVGGEINVMTSLLRIEHGAAIQSDTGLEGQSGDIRIAVDKLELLNGGQVKANANSQEAGTAGNIIIQASQYILVDGKRAFPDDQNAEERRVSTIQANTRTQKNNIADTGNISLATPLLLLQDNAVISANSDGSQGGDISLKISGLLFLNKSSRIESNASSGGGGSIQIKEAPFILSPLGSNSDITANSDRSTGGLIFIESLGIEGFKIDRTSQNLAQLKALQDNKSNDIAASSGNPNLQGEVVISNPNSLLQEFAQLETPLDESSNIEHCQNSQSENSSQFRFVGQGGMVPSSLANIELWDDTRAPTNGLLPSASITIDIQPNSMPREPLESIIQAAGWVQDHKGRVTLTAHLPHPSLGIAHQASTFCHSLG